MEFPPETNNHADNDITRELNNHLKELIKAQKEYSRVSEKIAEVLFVVAVVQLVVSVFQLMISYVYSDNFRLEIFGLFATTASLVFLLYFSFKVFRKNEK